MVTGNLQIANKRQLPAEVFDMAECLVATFHPERIYLFGSVARGDVTPDGDYDFMVIVPESPLPQYRRSQQAHRALADFHKAKDVLVWEYSACASSLRLAYLPSKRYI